MRVVALLDSKDHVCCRYRLAAFTQGLSQHGHALELHALPRGLALWSATHIPQADAILLPRKLLPRWELLILRRRARRLIFDYDDAVFSRDSYHRKGPESEKLRSRFAATVRTVDLCLAGNDWLAERGRHVGARQVVVIPTVVDAKKYVPAQHQQSQGLTLTWIGSASTLQGLVRFRPLLEQLAQAMPKLKLRLVCDRVPTFEHLEIEHWPWSEADEAQALATADVGISILPDDDWSRGKCGLKVLQYQAAGLPVVGNPVGVTPNLVRPTGSDRNGFLAHSIDQWVDALRQLQDPTLRAELGENGRRLVEVEYSIKAGLDRWLSVLGGISSGRLAG